MPKLRTALATMLITAAFPAAAAAADDTLAGTYKGDATGVKASIVIDDRGDGVLDYTLKSSCGKSRGTIELEAGPTGTLKGTASSRKSSVLAKVKADRGEPTLSGSLRHTVAGKGDDQPCKAKRTFSVTLDADSSPQVESLSGHYAGAGEIDGLPISFDVGFDDAAGSLRVTNLSFSTNTECYDDLDEDGAYDTLITHISGLEGDVSSDGSFEIDYTPDDDTEFYVEGTLEDGEADIYLEVGGFFAADGTPQAGGPYECDSWGEDYTADR